MATAAPATGWTWPADVQAFAADHNVTPELEPVLQLTRRLFPDRFIGAEMKADYEMPDERYITIWVNSAGLTLEQLRAAETAWHSELRRQCLHDRDRCFFLATVSES